MPATFKRKHNVGGPSRFSSQGSRMPAGPHMRRPPELILRNAPNVGAMPMPGYGGAAWGLPWNVGGYAAPLWVDPWPTMRAGANVGARAVGERPTRTPDPRFAQRQPQGRPRCFDRTKRIVVGGAMHGTFMAVGTTTPAQDGSGEYIPIPDGGTMFLPYCPEGATGKLPGGPKPGVPGGGSGGGGGPSPGPGLPPTKPPGGSNGGGGGMQYWPGQPGGCNPVPIPVVPEGPDNCPQGWVQCKQPIPMTSLAVGAGATVPITVTPRRVATPVEFVYTGALLSFTIDSILIDGTDYFDGAVPADVFQPAMTDLRVQWGQFSSTTPLVATVTSIAAGAADFRGTIMAAVARG